MAKLAKMRPKPQSAVQRFDPSKLIATTEQERIALIRRQQPNVVLGKSVIDSIEKRTRKNKRRVLHNNEFDDLRLIERMAYG